MTVTVAIDGVTVNPVVLRVPGPLGAPTVRTVLILLPNRVCLSRALPRGVLEFSKGYMTHAVATDLVLKIGGNPAVSP